MKLDNTTPHAAYLLRTGVDTQRIFACLVARITFDVVGGGLRLADEQLWGVSPGPWDGPCGPMPGDQRPVRGGVDVMIFGSARAAGGRPVPVIEVEVLLRRDWRCRLHAWGDRVWRSSGAGLVPGAPEPTRAVPLTLARAYGGSDEWDGIRVPFVDNPEGRGFYLQAARARNQPLPNLEDPDHLVRAWNDRPAPVGTGACAETFGPRVRRGIVIDEQTGQLREVRPVFFNDAFPDMVAPAAAPGDLVSVRGVREDGAITFVLPPTPLRLQIQIGDDGGERTPTIDQIGVDADNRKVFLTYRFPFRYWLTPHQRRSARLIMADDT